MSNSAGEIVLQTRGRVAHLFISNEERRNAISSHMWESIAEAVQQVAKDDELRVLVVEGAGRKAFSAGADIKEFAELLNDPARLGRNNELVQAAQQAIELLDKPTIAKVRGACVGGGCGLALACDFRIATPEARFGITPAKLGLLYSVADTRRLYNLVGPALSREMLFTGKILNAEEAKQAGMITRLVDDEQFDSVVEEFAAELAATSRYSLRGIKATLGYLEGTHPMSEATLQELFDRAFEGEDFNEGRQAFLEKRSANF